MGTAGHGAAAEEGCTTAYRIHLLRRRLIRYSRGAARQTRPLHYGNGFFFLFNRSFSRRAHYRFCTAVYARFISRPPTTLLARHTPPPVRFPFSAKGVRFSLFAFTSFFFSLYILLFFFFNSLNGRTRRRPPTLLLFVFSASFPAVAGSGSETVFTLSSFTVLEICSGII